MGQKACMKITQVAEQVAAEIEEYATSSHVFKKSRFYLCEFGTTVIAIFLIMEAELALV